MSYYERFDRAVEPRSRQMLDYQLVYAVCFAVLLVKAGLRRAGALAGGHRRPTIRSIVAEARIEAANCATSSFMGM